jgi:uncharacterized protein YdeI (YjbR/CyaY-like superfamily)
MEPDPDARTIEVPEDLAHALLRDPESREVFAAFSYSHQKAYIEWIESAKKAETRAGRMRRLCTKSGRSSG